MAIKGVEKLGGADIRAERSRHKITQAELAQELGLYELLFPSIENDEIKLEQSEYVRMLDAISRIVARRAEAAAAEGEQK